MAGDYFEQLASGRVEPAVLSLGEFMNVKDTVGCFPGGQRIEWRK